MLFALSVSTVNKLVKILGRADATALVGEIQSGDVSFSADTISEFTAGVGVTIDSLLIQDGKVDLNGVAAALILDADGDTTFGATADNTLAITIGGAVDFAILANTFVAVAGSTINTNTIAETTADSGVTIDSVLVKDGGATFTGAVTITDVNVVLSATTGTKIGTATGQKLAFYNSTPIVQPGAYTQTFATADKTHANPTAAALTVTDGAGTNDGIIGAITGDASVIAAVQELAAQINKIIVDHADTKALVNSVIDDLQALGLVG